MIHHGLEAALFDIIRRVSRLCACSSTAERLSYTQGVPGSNPGGRTIWETAKLLSSKNKKCGRLC